jgi:hypothetical protein
MPKDTIENRVYLFESLASSFVSASADALSSADPEVRARALRALGDLAYVSCVVADTQARSPEEVRDQVAGGGDAAPAAPAKSERRRR